MKHSIWTAREVAEYLRLDYNSFLKIIRSEDNKIPYYKHGNIYRFHINAINAMFFNEYTEIVGEQKAGLLKEVQEENKRLKMKLDSILKIVESDI